MVIAVLLGVAEVFTLTAVLGLLAGAALLTSGVAAVGLPLPLQLVVFAMASAAGLLAIRPIARRHSQQPRLERFGVDALVGRKAYAVTEVTVREGTVRIGGEDWTARSFDESVVIPAGATVNVMQIDGATAIVYPEE
ncbi:membrane protein [Pseudonocardia asaccharolytica DSM 44247 = NBRC 16224]|uniref:Membrane protein n=2 Tax=Pseudonocardia asaccharolytica TaxID=54010 RepID=A0A511D7I8_9PSEU|nr:membrane protein [Pseudonocardia asaccharolytica DSM 44247 = NBRC 16224]